MSEGEVYGETEIAASDWWKVARTGGRPGLCNTTTSVALKTHKLSP